MSKKYIVVIPARYKSTRFPGKPLIDLKGKSMVQRTYEQCLKAVPRDLVFVATEDLRIMKHCEELGYNAILTSDDCMTGTDRIAEVAKLIDAEYYINVQGDEPLFNPLDITRVVNLIENGCQDIINGYCAIESESQYKSISTPKVVFRPDGRLLYMSRSGIPGNKSNTFHMAWRQVCIYAFPKKSLEIFTTSLVKTSLENEEDIEILRFLELGLEVKMIQLSSDSIAVDNPEDVDHVLERLK